MSRVADPNRRRDILTAAREAFRKHGFEQAHMTDVARRANIAVGTLYLYFESKEAIASAIAAELFAGASAAIMPLLEAPLTKRSIALLVDRTFDAVFADESFGRIGLAFNDISATYAPVAYAEIVGQIAAALERQMKAGTVRKYDPETLADFIAILIRRAVLESATRYDRARDPCARTLKQVLCATLLPEKV